MSLPAQSDRNLISKARLISNVEDVKPESEQVVDSPVSDNKPAEPVNWQLTLAVSRHIRTSPFLNLYNDHFPLKVAVDSGATANLIKESTAHFINCLISKSSQVTVRADGQSELKIVGETYWTCFFFMAISSLFLKALLLII